jgi:hypothetical protein
VAVSLPDHIELYFSRVRDSFCIQEKTNSYFQYSLAIPALWIYMILWSYGMYGWRDLGLALHIYTPLIKVTEAKQIVESQMGYSVGSAFLLVYRSLYIIILP